MRQKNDTEKNEKRNAQKEKYETGKEGYPCIIPLCSDGKI